VPNITATDCVGTRVGALGFFVEPFCGTSAAAPHVAAIAALVIQRNPGLTSQQVRDIFAGTAVDLGGAGFDFTFGFGRVDAVNAITATPVPPPSASFFTLTPCRIADTRGPAGATGGPALSANTTRNFPVAGLCGVPGDATAVAINVTVVQETDVGDLRLYAAASAVPSASTINFTVNHVRANNAIIPLGAGGQISVQCDMPIGTTHFLFDVTGYFK
jgi:hypothetical protein